MTPDASEAPPNGLDHATIKTIRHVLAAGGVLARDLDWMSRSCPSVARAREYVAELRQPRDAVAADIYDELGLAVQDAGHAVDENLARVIASLDRGEGLAGIAPRLAELREALAHRAVLRLIATARRKQAA